MLGPQQSHNELDSKFGSLGKLMGVLSTSSPTFWTKFRWYWFSHRGRFLACFPVRDNSPGQLVTSQIQNPVDMQLHYLWRTPVGTWEEKHSYPAQVTQGWAQSPLWGSGCAERAPCQSDVPPQRWIVSRGAQSSHTFSAFSEAEWKWRGDPEDRVRTCELMASTVQSDLGSWGQIIFSGAGIPDASSSKRTSHDALDMHKALRCFWGKFIGILMTLLWYMHS